MLGIVWLSHTLISQLWCCVETLVHLAQRERLQGNFYSAFSGCFLVWVWSSCSFHSKSALELEIPHKYVLGAVWTWKETLCSQQARWRMAFTPRYLTELIICRDFHSSISNRKVCRETFTTVPSLFPSFFWNSCTFNWIADLKPVLPIHIYKV